jgi:hypothetical protein
VAVITGLCDQDHRACFGCEVSHSEITRIEQQLAKLTDPLLEARRILQAGRDLGGKVVCRFEQSGVQQTAHSGVYDFLQGRLIADDQCGSLQLQQLLLLEIGE